MGRQSRFISVFRVIYLGSFLLGMIMLLVAGYFRPAPLKLPLPHRVPRSFTSRHSNWR